MGFADIMTLLRLPHYIVAGLDKGNFDSASKDEIQVSSATNKQVPVFMLLFRLS